MDDPLTWKLPSDSIKGTQSWSVPWDTDDDSRLLVAIWKHGFGSWEAIQEDDTLGFRGKFFLEAEKRGNTEAEGTPVIGATTDKDGEKENGKPKKTKKAHTPGAVHLVRRGDYLLSVLRESDAAAKYRDRDSIVARKHLPQSAEGANGSGAESKPKKPRPASQQASGASSKKPTASNGVADGDRPASKVKPATTNTNGKRKQESDSSGSSEDESGSDSDTEIDVDACKEMLRPVKRELKELKTSDKLPREEKVKVLTRCLTAIGKRIDDASSNVKGSSADREKQRKHLWRITSGFWPIDSVDYRQIQAMYAKMTAAAAARAAQASQKAPLVAAPPSAPAPASASASIPPRPTAAPPAIPPMRHALPKKPRLE